MGETTPMRRWSPVAAGLVLLAGCRHEMYDQPRYEPQEASDFFADGKADRPLLPGVVPRLDPKDELHDLLAVGTVDGKPVETYPLPVDRPLIERGRQRYQIYCTPCHGERG